MLLVTRSEASRPTPHAQRHERADVRDGKLQAMSVRGWLTTAFDRTWLVWHKIDESVPRKQDLVDDVDAGLRYAAQRTRHRLINRAASDQVHTSRAVAFRERRPVRKSR